MVTYSLGDRSSKFTRSDLGVPNDPGHTIGQYRRHVRLLGTWLGENGDDGSLNEIDHEGLARFLSSWKPNLYLESS